MLRSMTALMLFCSLLSYSIGSVIPQHDALKFIDDKREFDRDFMHFGKRQQQFYNNDEFDRHFMPFGKRGLMDYSTGFDRDFMHFGKRNAITDLDRRLSKMASEKKDFDREFLHFGRKKRQVDNRFSTIVAI